MVFLAEQILTATGVKNRYFLSLFFTLDRKVWRRSQMKTVSQNSGHNCRPTVLVYFIILNIFGKRHCNQDGTQYQYPLILFQSVKKLHSFILGNIF